MVGGLCGPQAQPALFHSELQLLLASEAPLLPRLLAGHCPDNHRGEAWQQSQLRVPLSWQTTFQTLSHLLLCEAGRLIKINLWGARVQLSGSVCLPSMHQGPPLSPGQPTEEPRKDVVSCGYSALVDTSEASPSHTSATTT